MRRSNLTALLLLAPLGAFSAACTDTDVPAGGEDTPPGQEVGAAMEVDPVDLRTQRWVREGGTVEFSGRIWLLYGEPIFDPMVERVGEYEGTPLFAEVGTARPYNELYIPLENDLWQMLRPADEAFPDSLWGESQGEAGVEPVGDPTDEPTSDPRN